MDDNNPQDNDQDNSPHQTSDLPPGHDRITYDLTDDVQEALQRINIEQAQDTAISEVQADELTLKIDIRGASTPLLLTITDSDTVLGRRDPSSQVTPELDLTPYGGYQMGISRRHAILRLRENHLEVVDLGSRNGSYLNGNRLKAHHAEYISDGSELRLGKIIMRLNFQD